MKFSKYVSDTILSFSNSFENETSGHVMSLNDAAESARKKSDHHILQIIAGALSMQYDTSESKFVPMVIWSNGQHSFSTENIGSQDVEYLKEAANITPSLKLRTKLFHIIWSLTNDYRYGEMATDGYCQLFQRTFDPQNWFDCNVSIECAFAIAVRLGKSTNPYKQTRTIINEVLNKMDGSDPLFLSLNLLKLVIKDATAEELSDYYRIIINLTEKNIKSGNPNMRLADETYTLQELLLKKCNKNSEIRNAKICYARYYEKLANIYAADNEPYRAVVMLKKACSLYGRNDPDKLLELRSKLEILQTKAMQNMHSSSFEINITNIYNKIKKMFDGLTLQETIVQLSRTISFCIIEDVKNKLKENNKEFVFSSLCSCDIINEKGQTIQTLPPLNEAFSEGNSKVLYKHMVHYVKKNREIEAIVLKYAFSFLQDHQAFVEDDLDFLVKGNAIIPDGREDIVKEGLYLGLTGKLYASMHILLPQTEHIFRNLVKMCGDTITYLKDDGTEEYKPLSQLFESKKLHECFDEDIIFTFQSITDDPIGENLRNLNAHGILEPQDGNSSSALCFLFLFFKLLVMYKIETRAVLQSLAERDAQINFEFCVNDDF